RVSYMLDIFWFCVVCGVAIGIAWQSIGYIVNHFTYQDVLYVIWLGCITMFRVVVLIIIASIIWIPVGIWIGFRPHISSKIQPFA
ncbi:sulfonate ABC transporter permease, partial [Candidatus Liberibacter asiaticus]